MSFGKTFPRIKVYNFSIFPTRTSQIFLQMFWKCSKKCEMFKGKEISLCPVTWRSKYLGDGESGIWEKHERVWKSFWNLSYSFPPTIRHSRGIPVKPGEKLRTLRKILGENESWGEGNEETVPVVKPKDFWHWTDNFDFWLCFLFAGKDLESIFLVTAACEEKWSFSSCIPSLFRLAHLNRWRLFTVTLGKYVQIFLERPPPFFFTG